MPHNRNFKKRETGLTGEYRVKFIHSIQIVEPENAHPFVCPLCDEANIEKEYLRIYLEKSPNAVCVHSKCLINSLQKKTTVIRKHVIFACSNNHQRHNGWSAVFGENGMKPNGLKDA